MECGVVVVVVVSQPHIASRIFFAQAQCSAVLPWISWTFTVVFSNSASQHLHIIDPILTVNYGPDEFGLPGLVHGACIHLQIVPNRGFFGKPRGSLRACGVLIKVIRATSNSESSTDSVRSALNCTSGWCQSRDAMLGSRTCSGFKIQLMCATGDVLCGNSFI